MGITQRQEESPQVTALTLLGHSAGGSIRMLTVPGEILSRADARCPVRT
uniref:Uncharacterized protein n=1 Tax=Anguilla anguilla TaxID=7936 RepID=A0A0E9XPV2_ANGAN